MFSHNSLAFVCDLLLSVGIVFLVYKLIASSLRELLDKIIRIPEGTTFYLRALALVLICLALSKVVVGISLKSDAHVIEYVWAVGSHLSDVLENVFTTLLAFVVVVTVLVVVLRPKNGQ
jgi:hypothetical protein